MSVESMYTYEGFVERAKQQALERVQRGRWTRMDAERFVADAPKRWKEFGNESAFSRHFNCATCQDQGAIFVEGLGAVPCPDNCAKARIHAQQRYQHWKSKIHHMGKLNYTESLTFDSWRKMQRWMRADKTIPYMAARLYAESPNQYISLPDVFARAELRVPDDLPDDKRNSLIFFGDLGVGKTGLAAAIMWELEAKQIPVLMVRTYDLLEQLKSGYSVARREDSELTPLMLLRSVQQVPVLILDEWGTDRPASEWDKQQMEEIIRYRHAQRMPTVITTNMTPHDAYYVYWGARTADVLKEMAFYIEVAGARIRDDTPIIRAEGV